MDNKIMTPEEFYAEMLKIQKESSGDEEIVHIRMDNLMTELLTSLGYGDGVEIFDNTPMWYA